MKNKDLLLINLVNQWSDRAKMLRHLIKANKNIIPDSIQENVEREIQAEIYEFVAHELGNVIEK